MVFDHANFDNFPHPIAVRNVGSAQNAIFMYTVFDHNLCDTGPPSLRRQSPPKKCVEEERGCYTPKRREIPSTHRALFRPESPKKTMDLRGLRTRISEVNGGSGRHRNCHRVAPRWRRRELPPRPYLHARISMMTSVQTTPSN